MEQTQVRLDARMKERIRTFQVKFKKKTRSEIGFSEAIRVLLEQSLEREGIK
jgi:hypothetical protein